MVELEVFAMGFSDKLYARKRQKENMKLHNEFQKQREQLDLPLAINWHDSIIPAPECPICDYVLKWDEYLEQQDCNPLHVFTCPSCKKQFKT